MNDNQPVGFPGAEMFTRMWSDFAGQMLRAGSAFPAAGTPPEMSREMRTAMFKAWSDYCDQFMRSGEFLDMMKQSLNASVQARKQMNEFLGQMQHEFQQPTRQDVDQMMATLHQMESRLVDRLDNVGTRLEEMQTRVERLEVKAAKKNKKSERDKKRVEQDEEE